jgi:hypothetical protein
MSKSTLMNPNNFFLHMELTLKGSMSDKILYVVDKSDVP